MNIDTELKRIRKHFENISREELNEALKSSGAVEGEKVESYLIDYKNNTEKLVYDYKSENHSE